MIHIYICLLYRVYRLYIHIHTLASTFPRDKPLKFVKATVVVHESLKQEIEPFCETIKIFRTNNEEIKQHLKRFA